MSQVLATAAPGPGYPFDGHADHAAAQLDWLRAAYDPFTTERLAATGLRAGWHCLEIGAGNGSVAHWLADRVAPTGSVLATDLVPHRVPARPGMRVERHDIVHDPLPEGRFDLVHVRLVLQHLPRRAAVLAKLRGALRPGGVLQVDEFDVSYGPVLTAPDEDSARLYERFLAAKQRALEASGARVVWGRECPAELVAAGFTEVDPQPRITLWRAGHPGLELLVSHTHSLRERLLAAGLSEQDLVEVRAVMRDARFSAASAVFYSVQARRPH
ncbi:methyltransferase domain-containing protein [Kitasatospora nipponensis]|uniref:Methyltransferase domain-containing protein n=1 Tax=Kitasatospora nipponensis TaxID=258049 RepID=A0ABN1WEN2_9ACTN